MKKETTIDDVLNILIDFRDMVAGKFVEHDSFFEQIDGRFEQIDQCFDKMDKRFDSIDQHLASHDAQFEILNQKIDSLTDRVEQIEYEIKSIKSALDLLAENEVDLQKTDKFLIREVKRLDKELILIKKQLKIA